MPRQQKKRSSHPVRSAKCDGYGWVMTDDPMRNQRCPGCVLCVKLKKKSSSAWWRQVLARSKSPENRIAVRLSIRWPTGGAFDAEGPFSIEEVKTLMKVVSR